MQEIVSELSRTITRNGQRGFQRSFQALQAAVSISTEYIANFQQGIQEPPQVCPPPLLQVSAWCAVLYISVQLKRVQDCYLRTV